MLRPGADLSPAGGCIDKHHCAPRLRFIDLFHRIHAARACKPRAHCTLNRRGRCSGHVALTGGAGGVAVGGERRRCILYLTR